jgi:hypothetical protein
MDTTTTTSQQQTTPLRDTYGALNTVPPWVRQLLTDLDDGIAWTTGIESDRKRRGHAVNTAVYSYDDSRGLAVVQVRQAIFHPRRFTEVRKNYFLVGRNESGRAFAHPIEARASGRLTSEDVAAGVRLALTRIWDCDEEDLDDIVRNGDVAFVPVRRLPDEAEPVTENMVTIRESHHVQGLAGSEILRVYRLCSRPAHTHSEACGPAEEGPFSCGLSEHAHDAAQCGLTYYIRGRAKIEHAKHQHPTARVRGGIWRVQAGIRAIVWDFSRATVD